MANQQLIDYIKQNSLKGISDEIIRKTLLDHGWREIDINEAFNQIKSAQLKSNSFSNSQSINQNQPLKSNHKTLKIIIFTSIFLLIIGAIFSFIITVNQSPEKVLTKMWNSFAKVESFEYEGEMRIETVLASLLNDVGYFAQLDKQDNNSNKEVGYLEVNFKGQSDFSELSQQNPKGLYSFNIKANLLKKMGQESIDLGLETRITDKKLYAKLNGSLNFGFFDLSSLSNHWIEVDLKEAQKDYIDENLDVDSKLTLENRKKIKEVFFNSNILKSIKKVKSDTIEGVRVNRYQFSLDKQDIKNLIIEISSVIQEEELTEEKLENFNEMLATIDDIKGEFLIGKKDNLPYKISLDVLISDPDKPDVHGKILISFYFRKYNQPVKVEVPSPVKSIEEMTELFKKNMMPDVSDSNFSNRDDNLSALVIEDDNIKTPETIPNQTYKIGDIGPAGGVIFYIDENTNTYYEAPTFDQFDSNFVEWGCYETEIKGADGTTIGTGRQNTKDILAVCSERPIAASICDDLTLGGKSDWFLPSKDLLNEMYIQKSAIGTFST